MNLKKDWITIGCQDLGFYHSNNGIWSTNVIADGLKMIFDPFDSIETIYGQYNGDGLLKFNNKGNSVLGDFYNTGSWQRKMKFDALGNLYIGNDKKILRKKVNINAFQQIGNFTGAKDRIWGIGISRTNPNVGFVGFDLPMGKDTIPSNRFFKTTNLLSDTPIWVDISATLPLKWLGISDIIVDPNNENQVWVITGMNFTSNTTGQRVYYSSNGASSFTPIDLNLSYNSTSPLRFPVNVAVLDEANGGMYLGTDIGVFYNPNPKNATSPWSCFNKDMPTAIVTDLKIDYCSRKILASTYGRGLWESKLAENPSKDYVLTSNKLLNINAGEVRLFYSDITIPAGQVFTIKGTVKMATNTKITINPGGKIIIDGGKITSTCDLPWEGIYVEGNLYVNQSNFANQGYAQLKSNAIIENAKTAISLIGLNSDGSLNFYKTGGFINAWDANFVNNKKDIAFMSYHPINTSGFEVPNRSFFHKCKFITNNNNKIPNTQLKQHITMWDVTGVRMLGCTFEDLRTTITNPKIGGRTGILTISSTFDLNEHCLTNNQGLCINTPSKFINLKTGIESFNNGTRGVISIEKALFNSYTGAFIQGVNGAVIRSNNFTIKHDVIVPNNTDYPFGLYLDKSKDFNTEGNQFTGTTGATNVANGGAAGLVIRNTGPNNSQFYRSFFDNLKMASQALSENRDIDKTKGLYFRCNDYEQTWNDLDIREDILYPSINKGYLGMKELQGQTSGNNPDNNFANNSSILNMNIENLASKIDYFFNGTTLQSNKLHPFFVDTNLIKRKPQNKIPSCPNLIQTWGKNRNPLLTQINSTRPSLINKNNQILNLTDGGNTNALKTTISNANASNVNSIVNQLLSLSPHLSNDVLALIAQQNAPFTNTMIRDILIANPHSARCLWTQTNLNTRSNPLSSAFRNQINAGLNTQTLRDTLATDLSELMEKYDFTLDELLNTYLTDTTVTIEDYANYLKHPTNPNYHYQLAEMYFDTDNWNKFILIKDSIPIKFSLNEQQTLYHTSFSNLFTTLNTWKNSSLPMYYPDAQRKAWLLNFVNANPIYPAKVLGLLALNDTIINKPNVYIPEPNGSVPSQLKVDLIKENELSPLNIYPNPIRNELTLSWKKGKEASFIKIVDLHGKLITEMEWLKASNLTLQTSNWQNGLYFVTITKVKSKETITRKIIVNN